MEEFVELFILRKSIFCSAWCRLDSWLFVSQINQCANIFMAFSGLVLEKIREIVRGLKSHF